MNQDADRWVTLWWVAVEEIALVWGVQSPSPIDPFRPGKAGAHRGQCRRCKRKVSTPPDPMGYCLVCGPPPLVRDRILEAATKRIDAAKGRAAAAEAERRAAQEAAVERVQSHARDIAELVRLRAENEALRKQARFLARRLLEVEGAQGAGGPAAASPTQPPSDGGADPSEGPSGALGSPAPARDPALPLGFRTLEFD